MISFKITRKRVVYSLVSIVSVAFLALFLTQTAIHMASEIKYLANSSFREVPVMSQQYVYADSKGEQVLRWGISRKGSGKVPDANPGAPELISKYKGFYLGDIQSKRIYLTFDEGYENGYTSMILDTLRKYNVPAAFFITGHYLKGSRELVKRMVNEGHTVGNHSVYHKNFTSISDNEIIHEVKDLEKSFNDEFGYGMIFVRPPMGEYNERVLKVCSELGYYSVFWSFAYDDWYKDRTRGEAYARKIITENLHPGAIILLHAVSVDNARALEAVINDARAMGYTFGKLEEFTRGWK